MTTKEILVAARERISDRDRWCQRTLEDHHGRVCALGAIITEKESRCVGSLEIEGESYWDMPEVRILASLLPRTGRIGESLPERISSFNDTSSHECVLAVFDAAIAAASFDAAIEAAS